MRRPPSVAPLAPAQHAPDLVFLFVCPDWQQSLKNARDELRRYGETTPALGLPVMRDPAEYRWPVGGRHVAIYGTLLVTRLRRLMAALLRDGAAIAAGIDTDGHLHTATSTPRGSAAA